MIARLDAISIHHRRCGVQSTGRRSVLMLLSPEGIDGMQWAPEHFTASAREKS
jgi:hypothetical protein